MIRALLRGSGSAFLLTIASSGCGTEPEDRLFDGNYVTSYDPSQLISAGTCDRLISYVFLSMGSTGDFDLSINVTDDCTRTGGGISSFEMLKLGLYTRQGSMLTFAPEAEDTHFSGVIDGAFIKLRIPPTVGELASTDIELVVGPRQPLFP